MANFDTKRVTEATAAGAGRGAAAGLGTAAGAGTALALLVPSLAAGPAAPLVAAGLLGGGLLTGALGGGLTARGKERRAQREQTAFEKQQKELEKQQKETAKQAAFDEQQMAAAQASASQRARKRGAPLPFSPTDAALADNIALGPGNAYDYWRKSIYG